MYLNYNIQLFGGLNQKSVLFYVCVPNNVTQSVLMAMLDMVLVSLNGLLMGLKVSCGHLMISDGICEGLMVFFGHVCNIHAHN